jgi:predicted metal-binding membrane protein
MWALMMVATMLPSAAPMLLLHAAVLRQRRGGARWLGRTALFALGYLLVWTGFSAVATVAQ